ncbi:uncharacterized protein LOC123265637 isoform X2 [Cotesia glomerata]|uniref:uncharacterized protein LOC123265637 isoform X2 n=1 Tax=Cotesia glomerata TaxID=32391 RepID=UPI001D02EB54|nr:uncharacterized protein LOC123265637 isoform X2 [Cotesia glomerata]
MAKIFELWLLISSKTTLNPGNTPLHLAILKQNTTAVEKLLEEGADLMAENKNHQNPLQIAVNLSVDDDNDDIDDNDDDENEVVNLLINHISEDNITKEAYFQFLHDLINHGLHMHAENLLEKCLTFHINLFFPTPTSNCLSFNLKTIFKLITHFLMTCNPEKVKAILENVEQFGSPEIKVKFDSEFLNCNYFFRFFLKGEYNKEFDDQLGIFIEHGLDVNIRTKDGWSVMHSTFDSRCTDRTKNFLKYGAEMKSICLKKLTPVDLLFGEVFPTETDDHLKVYRFANFISQHFLKMRLLNQFVCEKDYQKVMKKANNLYRYEEEYIKEIDKMKATVINNYVTYYDIVRADLYKMVKYLEDLVIFETLKSGNYESEFPKFKIIISGCFYRAFIRKKLLDEVSCYTIFDVINTFPYPCMRSIMDNFSNRDLRYLIYQFRLSKRS